MKRIKKFGLAMCMALVLTALSAPSALASWFVSEASSTTVAGTQTTNHIYKLNFGEFACTGSSLNGTMGATAAESVQANVSDSNCSIFGPAPMKANGCKLTFRPGAKSGESTFAGTFEIGPVGCGPIKINAPGFCEVSIGSQTGLSASYVNSGAGSQAIVTVNAKVTNLKYTLSGGCGNGTFQDGSFTGSWALKGSSGGKQVGLQVASQVQQGFYLTGEKSAEESKQPRFEAEKYPASISGNIAKTHRLTTPAGEIKCSNGQFSGNAGGATSKLLLSGSYSGCTMFGETSTVDMNFCYYAVDVDNTGPPYGGSTDLECVGEAEAVEYTAFVFGSPICTVSLEPQTIGATAYEVQGTGATRHVVANISGKGLSYSVSGGGGFCGKEGNYEDGAFSGAIDLKGWK